MERPGLTVEDILRTARHIREYRDDDREAIRACIVGLQEFERRIDDRLRPGEAMATAYPDQTIERCRTADGRIFVAEDTGQLAGFAAILARVPFEALDDPPGAYALITDLFVRESFRRRGVGRALIAAAERHARTAGATELRIGVLSENAAALALYQRAGFTGYLLTLTQRLEPDVSTRRRV